jgi:hypothetical protein
MEEAAFVADEGGARAPVVASTQAQEETAQARRKVGAEVVPSAAGHSSRGRGWFITKSWLVHHQVVVGSSPSRGWFITKSWLVHHMVVVVHHQVVVGSSPSRGWFITKSWLVHHAVMDRRAKYANR